MCLKHRINNQRYDPNPITSSEYNKRTVIFTPTFQGDWFKEFLTQTENKKPSLNEFPPEWIEKCHKLVKRDMNAVVEMKKITLEDLKEVVNMHKLILSYYDNLVHFDELLKMETIRRTVKIEEELPPIEIEIPALEPDWNEETEYHPQGAPRPQIIPDRAFMLGLGNELFASSLLGVERMDVSDGNNFLMNSELNLYMYE
ncbi:hypothetical protein V9T40_000781 [Parthenolecanium corni]|uniref:Uncharacterized protein n=1 Tax=Parthenolecanium corni TaxID=536013 RepID=A0AAN9Y0S2_9HEMI